MRVLGIDPGTAITGYGVVDFDGTSYRAVEYDCVRTDATQPLATRLKLIYQGLHDVVKKMQPDYFAVEELFFNKNVRTALAVGHARGVALLVGANAGMNIYEYTPLQVKQAVAGYGRADKRQVQFMVKTLLGLTRAPSPDDVADALAVAICHANNAFGLGGLVK